MQFLKDGVQTVVHKPRDMLMKLIGNISANNQSGL